MNIETLQNAAERLSKAWEVFNVRMSERFYRLASWRLRISDRETRAPVTDLRVTLSQEYGDEYRSYYFTIAFDPRAWFQAGFTLNVTQNDYNTEDDNFSVSFPFVSLYFGALLPAVFKRPFYRVMERVFAYRNPRHSDIYRYSMYSDREIECRVYRYSETWETEYVVRWNFWKADGISYSDEDWWRSQYIVLNRVLFGRENIENREGPEVCINIEMPERSYRWVVHEKTLTYSRPRWWLIGKKPVVRIVMSGKPAAHNEHISFPGKGENDYDLGMDGTFGFRCKTSSVQEFVDKLRENINTTRRRRGWTDEDAIQYVKNVTAKHTNPSEPALNGAED